MEDYQKWIDLAIEKGSEYGLKILMAVVIWTVGKWVIGKLMKVFKKIIYQEQTECFRSG